MAVSEINENQENKGYYIRPKAENGFAFFDCYKDQKTIRAKSISFSGITKIKKSTVQFKNKQGQEVQKDRVVATLFDATDSSKMYLEMNMDTNCFNDFVMFFSGHFDLNNFTITPYCDERGRLHFSFRVNGEKVKFLQKIGDQEQTFLVDSYGEITEKPAIKPKLFKGQPVMKNGKIEYETREFESFIQDRFLMLQSKVNEYQTPVTNSDSEVGESEVDFPNENELPF